MKIIAYSAVISIATCLILLLFLIIGTQTGFIYDGEGYCNWIIAMLANIMMGAWGISVALLIILLVGLFVEEIKEYYNG